MFWKKSLLISLLSILIFFTAEGEPAVAPNPEPVAPYPWTDGEKLTYSVYWGFLQAAQGVFEAHDQSDKWKFLLTLKSEGAVQLIYPFNDKFTSQVTKSPWRSLSYTENRSEPNRILTDESTLDYFAMKGKRIVVNTTKNKKEEHLIKFTDTSLDDLGSMLYRLRSGPWKPGDKRTLFVYESNSEKEGHAECLSVERKAFGTWPIQPLLKISVLPGKGTKRKGSLMLWMTNDVRRLVLHADLIFIYGTFSVDLTQVEKSAKSL